MDKLKSLLEANRLNELISLELSRYISSKITDEITPKQHLCMIFTGNSKSTTAGKISKILDISKSSTSQLLNRLEKKNYIKRELNIENKKETKVSLDNEGIIYFTKYKEIKKSVIIEYFSFLQPDEIDSLLDINEKVLNHIRSKNDI